MACDLCGAKGERRVRELTELLQPAMAVPPAPCPSYGRCTYPDCDHFLNVTRGVNPCDGGGNG